MFDLNVDVVPVDLTSEEPDTVITTEKLSDAAGAQTDYSGTSISSVVNADEAPISALDEDSSSANTKHSDAFSAVNFNIFNKGKCSVKNFIHIQGECENSAPELVTRQLFPVDGDGGGGETERCGSRSSSATSLLRPQWLNLSVLGSGAAPNELRNLEQQKQQQQQPQPQPQQQQVRKSRRGPRSRSSQYRGVTFYRRTGRWESHIWDCGKQVYLGGFDTAHAAARAYDRAALKFRGADADINFNSSDYEEDMSQVKNLTKEEFIHTLRRQSTGFTRGSSKYRGVTLHKCGRWEARMGQFLGKKANDKAAIQCNGREAVTNFQPTTYEGKISLVANNEGGGLNLDLNLWISPPLDSPKGNDNVKDLHFHYAAGELPDGKKPKVESPASAFMGGQTPHGITMAPKHPVLPGMYTGFMPNYEERTTTGKREAEAVLTNWAWQMHGHGVVTPVPLFSTAASSGFSSTTPFFSSSLLPLNTQRKTTSHNLCLPTTAVNSTYDHNS